MGSQSWTRLGDFHFHFQAVQCLCSVASVMFDSATPWTVACQIPLSTGFPRREDWSELSFPSPGHLPDPRDWIWVSYVAGEFFTAEPPGREGNGTPLQYSCLENSMDGGRLQSMGSLRVRHDWVTSLSTLRHWRRKWQPTPVFLPGESQGRGSLVGRRLWSHTESDMTKAT